MIAATIMSVTFTPVFYVVMKKLGKRSEQPIVESQTSANETSS